MRRLRYVVPLVGVVLDVALTAMPAHADVVNLGACQKAGEVNQSPGHTGNGPLIVVTRPDGSLMVQVPGGFDGGSGCLVGP